MTKGTPKLSPRERQLRKTHRALSKLRDELAELRRFQAQTQAQAQAQKAIEAPNEL